MKKYFKHISKKNRKQCKAMWKFFLVNCADAKGSSHNHQAWKGGYFKHIQDTMLYATILYKQLSKIEKLDFSLGDAILVLFLHDIEKPIKYSNIGFYSKDSQEIRDILIEKYQIQLSSAHIKGLKYIHGENEDYTNKKRVMSPLSAFCHCCDTISARIFYYKMKNTKTKIK